MPTRHGRSRRARASHYAPTKAALEAGKHVYCEWLPGRTAAEAEELAAIAKANHLTTAVGLQARVNPALMLMREQVAAGFVGDVMAVRVRLLRDGVLSRPSHRTWQRDGELGANTLTIAAGHTVDAMRFVVGDFGRLSAVLATQARQWLDTGSIVSPPRPNSPAPETSALRCAILYKVVWGTSDARQLIRFLAADEAGPDNLPTG